MSKIVGIDLGTTNSLVGVMDSGFPILIADAEGHRLTPSVVHFEEGGGTLVGHPARRIRALHPATTVSSVKRFMGRRAANLTPEERQVSYPLDAAPDGSVHLRIRDRAVTPVEVSALILGKLKADAERDLGEPVTRAVITVPAYFNDAQRTATKLAGEQAGFQVERILNEPTAAALAYGVDKGRNRGVIAVYDLGGGTFDISILELNLGVFEVRSTTGNTRLGGDDVDLALAAWLGGKLTASTGVALDDVLRAQLAEQAEHAKIALSTATSTRVQMPFFRDGKSFECEVTRAELEALAAPIVERTRAHCLRALSDAKIRAEDLDEVILVGGMTRMPLVRKRVAEIFGREPNTSINPDEAVGIGAALQAGILDGSLQNLVLLDVTPLSLGLETFGGLMNVIIPRNSTIPVKAGEMFTTAVTNQKSMKIHVLQGEREMARDNFSLGSFELEFEPAPKGVPRVGVQFEIDADGILHVLARDIKTGAQKVVDMSSAVDVTDEKVERMIAESVEHAFDDMSERQWTEGKIRAGEMITATRHALATLHGRLIETERRGIEDLIAGVEQALESRDISRLKDANRRLDEGTQGLAQAMMDHAMDEALKRKGLL
jgi:molecular chaperone DnaK